jgi:hypothetical protein
MHVISASRRTDIPAFYGEWLVNRLKAGFALVRNPYSRRISRVSLKAADVSALYFCSKNYGPLLPRLEQIETTTGNLFFHFTITANMELELNVPDYRDAVRDYLYLAGRYSPEQIIWRYDPVCITDKISFDDHEERFLRIAGMLKGNARKCYISFVHPYKRAVLNLQKYTDHRLAGPSLEQKQMYARRLAEKAASFGITLYACCNDYLVSDTILKASCIDGRTFSEVFQAPVDTRAAASRKECACTRSIDIGAYDTCPHGCVYCYANSDKERASAAHLRHDPGWNSLGADLDEEDAEAGRDMTQTVLFP